MPQGIEILFFSCIKLQNKNQIMEYVAFFEKYCKKVQFPLDKTKRGCYNHLCEKKQAKRKEVQVVLTYHFLLQKNQKDTFIRHRMDQNHLIVFCDEALGVL